MNLNTAFGALRNARHDKRFGARAARRMLSGHGSGRKRQIVTATPQIDRPIENTAAGNNVNVPEKAASTTGGTVGSKSVLTKKKSINRVLKFSIKSHFC